MARKYYAKLFREYCIADLSRYKVIVAALPGSSTLRDAQPGVIILGIHSMPRWVLLLTLNRQRRMVRWGCGGAQRRRWLQARGSSSVARAAATCGRGLHLSRCAATRYRPLSCARHIALCRHSNHTTSDELIRKSSY